MPPPFIMHHPGDTESLLHGSRARRARGGSRGTARAPGQILGSSNTWWFSHCFVRPRQRQRVCTMGVHPHADFTGARPPSRRVSVAHFQLFTVGRVGLDVVGETEEGVVKFCVVVSGKSEIVVTPPEVSEKWYETSAMRLSPSWDSANHIDCGTMNELMLRAWPQALAGAKLLCLKSMLGNPPHWQENK